MSVPVKSNGTRLWLVLGLSLAVIVVGMIGTWYTLRADVDSLKAALYDSSGVPVNVGKLKERSDKVWVGQIALQKDIESIKEDVEDINDKLETQDGKLDQILGRLPR